MRAETLAVALNQHIYYKRVLIWRGRLKWISAGESASRFGGFT